MGKLIKQVLCAAAFLVGANAQAAITNGDFESGDFTGWTLAGSQDLTGVTLDYQHGGLYAAFFGEVGAPSSIAQSLSTTAGQTYSVSFWISNLGGNPLNPNTFSTAEVLVDGASAWSLSDKTVTDYTQYQFQFTAAASSTELAFSLRHDETFWLLDDIVVSAVPEPATVLLLISGLGLLAVQRRRNLVA